jgi:hypothetical protein
VKKFLLAGVMLLVVSATANAQCARPDEKSLDTHNCYTNRGGAEVHVPARPNDGNPPAGTTARCADGTYSYSQNRSGTCSHHGGVSSWTPRTNGPRSDVSCPPWAAPMLCIQGAVVPPPPACDMSPEARAVRAYPAASEAEQRCAYLQEFKERGL